jgi:hypothetical protein
MIVRQDEEDVGARLRLQQTRQRNAARQNGHAGMLKGNALRGDRLSPHFEAAIEAAKS